MSSLEEFKDIFLQMDINLVVTEAVLKTQDELMAPRLEIDKIISTPEKMATM